MGMRKKSLRPWTSKSREFEARQGEGPTPSNGSSTDLSTRGCALGEGNRLSHTCFISDSDLDV